MLFDRLCKKLPENSRCRAGYAIALEKLGAYKAAAAQAKKDLELTQSPEHKSVAEAYIASLEKRPPLKYTAASDKPLKGRYLAFFGGNLNREDGQTTYAFSSRVGRFVSERLDISANAAINGGNTDSDFNGLTLGVGTRYNKPLSFVPLNGTLAAKMERVPAPEDNFTFLISPGISYFTNTGSLDLFIDFALSGPFRGSRTISAGYTVYFGGGK